MITVHKNWVLATLIVSFFLGAFNATADQFGTTVATDWQNWAAFSQGGGVSDSTADDQSGSTYVKGNVGVWGTGNVNLSGNAILDGDLYYRSTGTLKLSGKAKITGMQHHNGAGDFTLQQSSNEAIMEATQLKSLTDSANYTYTINNGSPQTGPLTNINTDQNITIMGTPGQRVVLDLQNFVLKGGGTLTLQGSGTKWVFNISSTFNPSSISSANSAQFSLSSSAKVVLGSGVSASNIVYNVLGTGTDSTVSSSAQLKGILLANYRNVALSGNSITTGEVVGNKVTIGGSAQLIHASP